MTQQVGGMREDSNSYIRDGDEANKTQVLKEITQRMYRAPDHDY